MAGKYFVSIELVVGVRRSIPWKYARAARLRTVLDDDGRIDASPTRVFCLVIRLGPGFHIFIFIFKKKTQEGPNRSEEQLFLLN